NGKANVRDDALLPLIEASLDTKDPRSWYSALMDYGTHLKKLHGNPSRKSAHHTRQSAFAGSDRQIRGAIVREMIRTKRAVKKDLYRICPDHERLRRIITSLVNDGMLSERDGVLRIR
ncbi:MAG: A/G-specific adenine glycosylase, partial [Spirochaetota bacterium]